MFNKSFIFVFKNFLIWRIFLFLTAFVSGLLIPDFNNSFPYVDRVLTITNLPSWIWGFGNFDGVHYLRIAQNGYGANFTQVFFPLFPLLINFFNILPRSEIDQSMFVDPSFFITGLILSNVFFVAALYYFYKMVEIDFDKKIARLSIVLLLVFPTSFFFGSIYTESLFLLLTVLSIYLIRKNNFLLASILIAFASATRVIGVFLIPLFLIEAFRSKNKLNYFYGLLTPTGLIFYMYYLNLNLGNPFYFFSSQSSFNTGRNAEELVLLPQVIYRYIKIFILNNPLTVNYLVSVVEILFTLLPLGLTVFYFKKINFSYLLFGLPSLLVGSLTGTLSSMPRYSIFIFIFLIPIIVKYHLKYIKFIAIASFLLLVLLTSLFIRGYFVA